MDPNSYIQQYLDTVIYHLVREGGKSHLIQALRETRAMIPRDRIVHDPSFLGIEGYDAERNIIYKRKGSAKHIQKALPLSAPEYEVSKTYFFDKNMADVFGMTADRQYDLWKRGVHTVEDLERYPGNTTEERIYCRHYRNIAPVSREDVTRLQGEILKFMSHDYFTIVGEYRRGQHECSEISIVVAMEAGEHLTSNLLRYGYLSPENIGWAKNTYTSFVALSSTQALHVIRIYRVPRDEMPTNILIRTGTLNFEIYVRNILARRGYYLTLKGVTAKKGQTNPRISSEDDILNGAGIRLDIDRNM